jgi:hypothetical protein
LESLSATEFLSGCASGAESALADGGLTGIFADAVRSTLLRTMAFPVIIPKTKIIAAVITKAIAMTMS